MARTVRRSGMKEVPLSEVKDDLSRFLREAETQEIVITRHGKPDPANVAQKILSPIAGSSGDDRGEIGNARAWRSSSAPHDEL
jgi:antitoxin (DNA-binding transcriptional repressor) of toxin-antitoxin stability system